MKDQNAAKEIERVVAAYQGGALKDGVVPLRKALVVDDKGAMRPEFVAHFATKGFAVSVLDTAELDDAEKELEQQLGAKDGDVEAAELRVLDLRGKHHPDLCRLALKKEG